MSRLLHWLGAASLIFATLTALAQTTSWRVATYGVESSAVDVPRGALAFDANDRLYAFEYISYIEGTFARLTRYASDGSALWQRDIPASLRDLTYLYMSSYHPTSALATVGEDAIVATTQPTFPFASGIGRYRSSDGQVIWQSGEQIPGGIGYNAVAVDGAGDVVAAGAAEFSTSLIGGHVAKYAGMDGMLRWSIDVDPALCGGAASLMLTTAATDANGDVIVAGAPTYFYQATVDFCVLKLDGSNGAVLWSHPHATNAPQIFYGGVAGLALDVHGNAAVSAVFSEGSGYVAFIAKLDGTGGATLWERTSSGDSIANLQSMAVDAQDNVYVSGWHQTRAYAAADGHTIWPLDAPVGGAVGVDTNGRVVVAENRMDEIPDAHTDFYALDPLNGLTLWHSRYAFADVSCCATLNILALDHSGHFAEAQRDPEPCCGTVITTIHGDSADGAIDWHSSDSGFAPSHAELTFDPARRLRVSALTPDDGVVAVGVAYLSFPISGTHARERIMVAKRSAHDGRLLWRAVLELDQSDCEPAALAVDGAGDVYVGGECGYEPVTVKYRGSDGGRLWVARDRDICEYAVVQSLALEGSGDVVTSGWCEGTGYENQLTVRYSGADGHPLWEQHTAGESETYSSMLDAAGQGIVFTVASEQIVSGDSERRLLVNALNAASGQLLWSQTFNPASGGTFSVGTVATLPNGDVLVSGRGFLARLAPNTGAPRWTSTDYPGTIAVALDAAGNPVFVADNFGLLKVDADSGALLWNYYDPAMTGSYGGFHDVSFAANGSVVATGNVYPNGDGLTLLHVASFDPVHGTMQWSFTDDAARGAQALGIVISRDGGVLVSADYAVSHSSPWSLVRISGPFTDGIFANGWEE